MMDPPGTSAWGFFVALLLLLLLRLLPCLARRHEHEHEHEQECGPVNLTRGRRRSVARDSGRNEESACWCFANLLKEGGLGTNEQNRIQRSRDLPGGPDLLGSKDGGRTRVGLPR